MASASEVITHHITNWSIGLSGGPAKGFWVLNLDSILMGWITAAILVITGIYLGRRVQVGVPAGMQNFLESVADFVDGVVKDSFPVRDPLIAPVAFTVFCWIFLMNLMDVLPAYLPGDIASFLGAPHFRVTATTDLNTTLAVALVVFLLSLMTNVRVKGGGYFKQYLVHPFGAVLFPLNIIMTLIEEVTKPLSLALRLFGNMFAGELVFLLVAMLPFYAQFVIGVVWSGFEFLIIILQAFIFMVLTVVYLGMAHMDSH